MKIAFAAHDAGGAEIVSSWILNHYANSVHALLEGPALRIFERKLPGRIEHYSRDQFQATLAGADLILTGTSWASDLEKVVHQWCKTKGKRCAAFLDHWTEYRQRFTLADTSTIPEEIWVGDKYALQIAQVEFPGVLIKTERNYYLENLTQRIKAKSIEYAGDGQRERLLYCTEPTSRVAETKTGDPLAYGYTEHTALQNMLEYLKNSDYPVQEFRLRKHPSETSEKYAYILKYQYGFALSLSTEEDLAEDCAWANTVVGCDSMAMAVGVLAGKKVLCSIPQGGRQLTNPFPEIQKLFI